MVLERMTRKWIFWLISYEVLQCVLTCLINFSLLKRCSIMDVKIYLNIQFRYICFHSLLFVLMNLIYKRVCSIKLVGFHCQDYRKDKTLVFCKLWSLNQQKTRQPLNVYTLRLLKGGVVMLYCLLYTRMEIQAYK